MASTQDPIIILGAARSGTTLLAETILARHEALAYWGEPSYIWRYGHAYRPSDVLHPRDATPKVREYIRRQFGEYLQRTGRQRLMEKTPGNCLRMPFVLEVFPQAQIVHVLRDGREVALSAAVEWAGRGGQALDSRGAREGSLPSRIADVFRRLARPGERVRDLTGLLEFPSHLWRFATFVMRQGLHASWLPWGPRFPGITRVRWTRSLLETCAVQWDVSVRMARSACRQLPANRYMELKYEDLLAGPTETVRRILEFLELQTTHEQLAAMTAGIVGGRPAKWPHKMSEQEIRGIEVLIGGTLTELGYELAGRDPGPQVAPGGPG